MVEPNNEFVTLKTLKIPLKLSNSRDLIKGDGIKISMDGKGRALDNVYIERFWRTIKYQHIYLNPASDGINLYIGIKKWLERYHNKDHQGINPHCSFNCNLFTKSGKKAVDKLAFAHMVIHKIMICSYLYFWI